MLAHQFVFRGWPVSADELLDAITPGCLDNEVPDLLLEAPVEHPAAHQPGIDQPLRAGR